MFHNFIIMLLIDLIIAILGCYLVYKFIFEFILPIYQASRKVTQQFRGMHERMNHGMGETSQPFSNTQQTSKTATKPKPGSKDYIDFEEVK